MDAHMRTFFLTLVLLCLACMPASAQFVGTFKAGNIYGNPTGAEAPPIDTPPASLGIVSGPASVTALDHACFADTTGKLLADCSGQASFTVLTAATTVATANCSQILYLQGGTQWTLTFPAASGLPNGCLIDIVNNEVTYAVGKTISGLPPLGVGGTGNFILYPTSRMRVQVVSGAWNYIQQPTRWVNSNGLSINWYVNNSTGVDTVGVNDGLSPSRPFKSAQEAIYTALGVIDCNGAQSEVQTVVNLATGQNDTTGVHWAPHDMVGCQGGAAVQLVGASLSIVGVVNNGSGLCRLILSQNATFFGFISGTTLTVTEVFAGDNASGGSAKIISGATITGSGVTGGTAITGYGTGSGGVGTYTVNNSQTVGEVTMSAALAGGGTGFFTGQAVMVYGIGGSTACNGLFKVTVVNANAVDLQSSTFNAAYTSGGTISYGSGFNGGFDIETYFGAVLELWNLSFVDTTSSGGNSLLNAGFGSQIYVMSGNFFYGSVNSSDMSAGQHARIIITAPYGIAGVQSGQVSEQNATQFGLISNISGFYFLPGIGINYTGAFASASNAGQILGGGSIVLNGATITGKRCEADGLSLVNSGTGSPNTYWPGNSICTTSLGGQTN